MVRNIVDAKDPILRGIAKPIKKIDKKIVSLARDLEDTLSVQDDPEGVGLAGPQIGKPLRIFAMKFKGTIRVIINPEVVQKSKEMVKQKKEKNVLEGCLSIPYYYGPVERSKSITIKFLDTKGKQLTEEFRGFPAQIVQHEIDHLNGKLFTDHVLKNKTPLYKIEGDDWEEVDFANI